ncbi:MAG TPA: hypothetical protein VM077_00325 [Candidatus Limnocylindrales bacterium]|nr:hypothetical protein [Candidatus Limnocylindrales bacterium]
MKLEQQCPYLEIKDNRALTTKRARLDTSCRIDCPLNGATFLGPEESPTSKSTLFAKIDNLRSESCRVTDIGKALENLKNLSNATKRTNSS